MNAQDRKLARKVSIFGWFIAAATCIACPPFGAALVGIAFVAKGARVLGERRAANEFNDRIDAALAIVNDRGLPPSIGYGTKVAPQDAMLCACGIDPGTHRRLERDGMVNHWFRREDI